MGCRPVGLTKSVVLIWPTTWDWPSPLSWTETWPSSPTVTLWAFSGIWISGCNG
jgi:hypothetical protein